MLVFFILFIKLKSKPIVQTLGLEYNKKAEIAPPILKITGRSFTLCGINSESMIILFEGLTNKAFPQKSVPSPIIISRVRYPIKIAPNLKINSGNLILKGDSCTFFIIGLKEFVLVKKVKYNNRIE
jgi:hypothetical protein